MSNEMSDKYVYGVLSDTARIPVRVGIGGAPLELIAGDGVAALVSDVPSSELRMGREEMTVHARVLEDAHALATVLPMRFGVVMDCRAGVYSELLDAHRDELLAQLADFEGKCELKLRATYEEESLLREVLAEDAEVARLRDSLRGTPDDATYYERIRLGELVAAGIQRRREDDAERIREVLEPLAVAVEQEESTHERIVLSASFLVDATRVDEFDAAVNRVGESQSSRMRFKYTGPLPPHSFVRLAAGV